MSTSTSGRSRLRAAPTTEVPLLAELRAAPELVVVDVLARALDGVLVALRAQHPTLDEPTGPDEPPTLRRARRVASAAAKLAAQLAAYRLAVRAALAPLPSADYDDIPF